MTKLNKPSIMTKLYFHDATSTDTVAELKVLIPVVRCIGQEKWVCRRCALLVEKIIPISRSNSICSR
jgi:hypothetical protein